MNIAKRIEKAGEEKGILIGMQEGIEEGKQKGAALAKIEIASALISTGQSIEYTSEVTGLYVEQVKTIHLFHLMLNKCLEKYK